MDSEALMRTYLERVVKDGDLRLIDEIAHVDMVDEANQAFGGPPGRDGLIAHVKGFHRCIADAEITIDRIIGNDDEVMAWWSFTGRHVGPWLGQPATDKPIQATVFSFLDLVDGRITRYRLWLHAGFERPVIFDSSRPGELLPG